MVAHARRPEDGLDGSLEFIEFLKELRRDGRINEAPSMSESPVLVGEVVDSGNGESLAIQLDSSGEVIVARRVAFPSNWEFQIGDVVGIHWQDGEWKTMPHLVRLEESAERIEFWMENRESQSQRLLAVNLVD